MDLEALPNTPSSAQMEPSSTKNTSSVTGGSTLTAQKLKDFTPWTKTLLLSVKLLLPPDPKDLPHPHKVHTLPQAEDPKPATKPEDKDDPKEDPKEESKA